MNKQNIALGVLGVAVAVLFVLHFTGSGNQGGAVEKADTAPKLTFEVPQNLQGAQVLYVNIDSINANYRAFSDLSQEAGNNLKYQMTAYQQKAASLQERYSTLQEKVNMGTISTDEASKEEASINAGLEELKRMEANLAYLESQAMQKNDQISAEIALYFKEYSKDKGIDYILMYGTGMPVIYANDSLDITNDVLSALNAEYEKNQAAGAGDKKK